MDACDLVLMFSKFTDVAATGRASGRTAGAGRRRGAGRAVMHRPAADLHASGSPTPRDGADHCRRVNSTVTVNGDCRGLCRCQVCSCARAACGCGGATARGDVTAHRHSDPRCPRAHGHFRRSQSHPHLRSDCLGHQYRCSAVLDGCVCPGYPASALRRGRGRGAACRGSQRVGALRTQPLTVARAAACRRALKPHHTVRRARGRAPRGD